MFVNLLAPAERSTLSSCSCISSHQQKQNVWFHFILFIFFPNLNTGSTKLLSIFPPPQRKRVVQLVHSILKRWKNRSKEKKKKKNQKKKKKKCYIRRWWGKSVQEEETNRWRDEVRETNERTGHTLLLISLYTHQMHRILSIPFLHKYLHFFCLFCFQKDKKLPAEWKVKPVQTAPRSVGVWLCSPAAVPPSSAAAAWPNDMNTACVCVCSGWHFLHYHEHTHRTERNTDQCLALVVFHSQVRFQVPPTGSEAVRYHQSVTFSTFLWLFCVEKTS